METGSFNFVGSRILSQLGENRLLQPIFFFFKNLNLAKYN